MKTVKKRNGNIRVWTILLVILGVIVAGLGITMLAFEPGRREALNLTIENVDFKKLRDGIYEGEYKGTKDSFRNAKVKVTVDSGTVTEIKATEGAFAGGKQTSEVRDGQSIDDLFDRVIDSQSLQVRLSEKPARERFSTMI